MKAFNLVTSLRLAIGLAATGALAFVVPNVFAQQVDEAEIEEIVVTGSHIKRDTFNYSTPVSIIDNVEIASTGTTNLGDLLQTLPQSI
jgi:outer membrane cobalamin receptor